MQAFDQEIATFQQILTDLRLGGDPVTEAEQCRILRRITAHVGSIPSILARHSRRFPAVADQKFADMVKAIKDEIPQATVGEMGFAGAARAQQTQNDQMKTMQEQIDSLKTALGKSNSKHGNHGGRGGGRGRGNPAGGRGGGRGGRHGGRFSGRGPAPNPAATRPYCFAHGYLGHLGKDCLIMQSEPGYTEDMKQATGPCIIDTWAGVGYE